MIPRRVALLGLMALLLAGAGIAAAVTHEDSDETPTALEQPVETTSSLPAETSTSLPAETSTTAAAPTSAPATLTTVGPTTTTRAGATTTTARATTTTSGPVTACTTPQVVAAVSTDKASYAPGEQVKVFSTLKNTSTTRCSYPSLVFVAAILNPAGATIISFDRTDASPGTLAPGQSHEASVSWDQISCAPPFCTQSDPGQYSVMVTWNYPGGPHTAAAPFVLT